MRLPLSALLTLPMATRLPRRRAFCSVGATPPPTGQQYAAGLAFDLETTGLDTRSAEIVQFAIVVANSQRGAKFSRLVLPEGDIDPGAAAVHGFTREVLLDRGARPFAEVWEECEGWLRETLGETRPLVSTTRTMRTGSVSTSATSALSGTRVPGTAMISGCWCSSVVTEGRRSAGPGGTVTDTSCACCRMA